MDHYAPVAQLDRALPSEGRGREFESRRVHQYLYLTAIRASARPSMERPARPSPGRALMGARVRSFAQATMSVSHGYSRKRGLRWSGLLGRRPVEAQLINAAHQFEIRVRHGVQLKINAAPADAKSFDVNGGP